MPRIKARYIVILFLVVVAVVVGILFAASPVKENPTEVEKEWEQLGRDIDFHVGTSDGIGPSIALSSEGKTVTAGVSVDNGNGSWRNFVRSFNWNSYISTWEQIGADIDGLLCDGKSRSTVALSGDGSILAVKEYCIDDEKSTRIRVFEWNGNTSLWVQMGSDIEGRGVHSDFFRNTLSLSSTGDVVAVGALLSDDGGNEFDSAIIEQVRVFQWNRSTFAWEQIGAEIEGTTVHLTLDDELKVAIGSPLWTDDNGSQRGGVRVFLWTAALSTWTQIGVTIEGEAPNDMCGASMFMTDNTTNLVMLVGSPNWSDIDGVQRGQVRYFSYDNETFSWAYIARIEGPKPDDKIGHSISMGLTRTETLVSAIGSRSGSTHLFKTNVDAKILVDDTKDWFFIKTFLGRKKSTDEFIPSISLGKGGDVAAIGGQDNVAHIRIYKWPWFPALDKLF